MLHFFSSLFSSSDTIAGQPAPALIEAAIERAIDGTDRRLRGLSHYRKSLRPAVETAVRHIVAIVEGLPAAIEISRDAFRSEPRLRAFFVSPGHIAEVVGGFPAVKDYIKAHQGALPESIYGCLSMDFSEKKGLGMQLHGETVQREVAQVTVSFSDHRYIGPSDSEATTRRELEKRGFDFLIEKALENMAASQTKRIELEQQRRILGRKLDKLRAGSFGLEQMLAAEQAAHPDIGQLESDIQQLDDELMALGARPDELEQRLQCLVGLFSQAPEWLTVEQIGMRLDSMLVKTDDSRAGAKDMQFTQVQARSGERRIILLGRFPVTELPEKTDFLKEAQRYLG